jgi:hypothetical protein
MLKGIQFFIFRILFLRESQFSFPIIEWKKKFDIHRKHLGARTDFMKLDV